MTYSIAARCDQTGEFGAAIATAMPAVGALCVWTQSGVGVVCTQSWTNPYLGLKALDRMAEGQAADAAGAAVLAEDQQAARRQLGVVGPNGPGFAFTGDGCTGWCGHEAGANFSAQGNMLTGPEVVAALGESFRENTEAPLGERLLSALEAAQRVGGDKRGRQSAAVAVIGSAPFRSLDLRVDDNPDPVAELRRVFTVARAQLGPMAEYRPNATGTNPAPPEELRAVVMRPPPHRPGGGGSEQP